MIPIVVSPPASVPPIAAVSANIPNIINSPFDNACVYQDLTIIQVMVATPKASPPIVRNKLSMIFSPFFRISDITVFLSHDSVMQTIAKPMPLPTTVVTISVVIRAVKPNIFISSFYRFLVLCNSCLYLSALMRCCH